MRALRLLSLAAAMVVPVAAAHAQVGVYVGPSFSYAAPGYAQGYWAAGPYGRYWVAPRAGWVGPSWRDHRDWDRDRDHGWDRGWDRDRDRHWDHDRR